MIQEEIELINEEIRFVKNIFINLVNILPSFDILNKRILPYGLKPHNRSIAWIVEQVIVQQMKYNSAILGLDDVKFNMPDTCLHDCEICFKDKRYFINIKTHNVASKNNKNDIAAVETLYLQYKSNANYRLIYGCFGVHFKNINISFDKNQIHCFSPQFLPIYINPRNDKIQAIYHHKKIDRTRTEFLTELKNNSKSIILD